MELVTRLEIDQLHALGVAPGLTNIFDENAHHLAASRDQHDFIGIMHRQRAHDRAGLLIGLHGDDAFAPA